MQKLSEQFCRLCDADGRAATVLLFDQACHDDNELCDVNRLRNARGGSCWPTATPRRRARSSILFLERMMEAVHRYVTVNQLMGGGTTALFGAPIAHEHHAVRACYAALRTQETVKQYAQVVRRAEAV